MAGRRKENSIPATLADVAREAGVGESTVSRVLRKSGSFSEHTRSQVLLAANKLGYVPNRIAGTLASTGSRLVGIIIPALTTSVFPDLLRGANSVLEQAGYQAVIGVTEYDPLREEHLIESLLSWRPEGLIITGLEHTARSRTILKGCSARIVELGDIDGKGIDIVVGFSNKAAGRAAAQFFINRRYRRIGYVGNDISIDLRAGKRFEGFKACLAKEGLSLTDKEVSSGTSSIRGGSDGLAKLLKRNPTLQAVYFANDDMAIGGYFHCIAKGISVPDDIALFGHNGLEIGRVAPLPLSTVRTPRAAVGEIGAKLLLSRGPAQVVDLGFELFEGATA